MKVIRDQIKLNSLHTMKWRARGVVSPQTMQTQLQQRQHNLSIAALTEARAAYRDQTAALEEIAGILAVAVRKEGGAG
ncbi:hypothetical protein [Azohydromonas lata]|uniref:hypothetical protein n=1 Tax=Azohydromonas lata TaxID=45677 RepID=UPI000837A176|nr:hypothetical protein [Azohydromonas lata]